MPLTSITQPQAANLTAPQQSANPKLAGPAHEFESILLNQWLQDAQSSFGAAPGGDDDSDPGGEQMHALGTQQLASFLSAHNGLGIARMVEYALQQTETAPHITPQSTTAQAAQLKATALALSTHTAEPTR